MPCFHPVKGYRARGGGFVSSRKDSPGEIPLTVPCGRCVGCRMDRQRDWSTRIAHEASLYDENSFLTLTYSDEFLPEDYSVSARPLQLFMKRLRKAISPVKIRFFACGEYGDDNGRPHFHAIIFGFGFPDKTPWRKSASGHVCYRSALLEKCWSDPNSEKPLGHCEIGTVTRESGGYVARYVLKKVGGRLAPDHYQRVHSVTGELCWVNPEFMVCSTRPGIGSGWFDKYASDAFPSDFVVLDGSKVPVPRYYEKQIAGRSELAGSGERPLVSVDDAIVMRRKRLPGKFDPRNIANRTDERLATREECLNLKIQRLERDLDKGST